MEIDQDVAVSVPQPKRLTSPAERILAGIAAEVGDSLFALWFSGDQCIRVDGDTVTVLADSDFECRRIQKGYASLIRRVATEVLAVPLTMVFAVRDPSCSVEAVLENTPGHGEMRQGGDLRLAGKNLRETTAEVVISRVPEMHSAVRPHAKPRYLLSEFAFGPENDFVRSAVRQVVQAPGQYSPLLICGGSGSGKTHLLEALASELRNSQRCGSCIYVTAEQFTSSFVHSLRGGGLPNFRRKYRDVGVLAIDDVQFFANKRATIHELQYTIDHLVRAGKQLLFSSDRPLLELNDLGPEVVNRLNSGLICQLQFAGEESRVKIVERMCRERNLGWGPDIHQLIAQRVPRDGRKLSGAINRIGAEALSRGTVVDSGLAEELLGLHQRQSIRLATIGPLEKSIAEFFGLSSKDLRATSRNQKVGNARMVAMYLCRRYTTAALSEIGEHFGGRSHSTVIAALHRVEGMIRSNADLVLVSGRFPIREVLQSLENKLRLA